MLYGCKRFYPGLSWAFTFGSLIKTSEGRRPDVYYTCIIRKLIVDYIPLLCTATFGSTYIVQSTILGQFYLDLY